MHEYDVALAISGDEIDEAEISALLNLKCSVFHRRGERRSPDAVNESSAWVHHVDLSEGKPEWQSLELGLSSLIQLMLSRRGALQELRKRYSVEAYCGHFGSGFGGGPSISPETMNLLADLALTLTINTYWRSIEPE